MKLFLIKRIEAAGYDENNGFVIREVDENAARVRAAKFSGDEPHNTWTDVNLSKCTEIGSWSWQPRD